MTDEFGATKGGPKIVDSLRKTSGEVENKTSEIPDGSNPKMCPASLMRSEIGIEGQTTC
jgi:hypothetical protein